MFFKQLRGVTISLKKVGDNEYRVKFQETIRGVNVICHSVFNREASTTIGHWIGPAFSFFISLGAWEVSNNFEYLCFIHMDIGCTSAI